jgi:hypothetical protein
MACKLNVYIVVFVISVMVIFFYEGRMFYTLRNNNLTLCIFSKSHSHNI